MSQENEKNQNQAKQIKLADNLPGAEYANIFQANHNKDEFHLMFGNISGNNGRVVSKVVITPGHFKRVIAAMQDNLKKYEERFGSVEEAAKIEEKEIGFKS